MLVKNVGHEGLILTEFNGKRYCFPKGTPVEISSEIYNLIIQSGHINAQDITPCAEETQEPEKETAKVVPNLKGKKKK
jgi:hypothetical protein